MRSRSRFADARTHTRKSGARPFLSLSAHAEFVKVFPEAAVEAGEWDSATQRYFLAKFAIGGPRPAQRRFGMELIHGLFGEFGAVEVERRFGLPLDWYLRMTGDPELIYGRVAKP